MSSKETVIEMINQMPDDASVSDIITRLYVRQQNEERTQQADTSQDPEHNTFVEDMEQIWARLKASGHVPRSREEIDAEVAAFRDEVEEHFNKIERLQEECRQPREQAR